MLTSILSRRPTDVHLISWELYLAVYSVNDVRVGILWVLLYFNRLYVRVPLAACSAGFGGGYYMYALTFWSILAACRNSFSSGYRQLAVIFRRFGAWVCTYPSLRFNEPVFLFYLLIVITKAAHYFSSYFRLSLALFQQLIVRITISGLIISSWSSFNWDLPVIQINFSLCPESIYIYSGVWSFSAVSVVLFDSRVWSLDWCVSGPDLI